MSGRLRGHYRIDSKGRVEPLGDVNAAAIPYTIPRAVLLNQPGNVQSRTKSMMIAGASILIVGLGALFAMPRIEQALLSAQNAHLASVRASYIQHHPGLQLALDRRR